ncbi:uncharacterized protein LOC125316028 [Rhodamnia argentea]|uniref:Uncharacterized protein LOC125316028 n=1 Tax=Rhodamnia argentea TaxID=178133 RepID=A0ABM3HQ86_9MYRT|nr:uncharacterized protein LOC125316028 [Rhodamnia argentea]
MINALSSMNIHQVLLLILVLLQAITCCVEGRRRCYASSCGDIHNISYPFRLKSDPNGCGDSKHELTCEDNHTVLRLEGGRYYVQSINYIDGLIRLVDDGLQKDNCSSLPSHSWALYNLEKYNLENRVIPNRPYNIYDSRTLVIVNCSKQVSSSSYITTGPCTAGSYSSNASLNWNLYALVDPKASDVKEFCNISGWTYFGGEQQITSSSYNYKLIHDIMADGFDLSFYETSLKKTFLCFFDFYSIYMGGAGCGSVYFYGKHWLAMRFYRNFA